MAIDFLGINPKEFVKNWIRELMFKKIGDYGKLSDIHLDLAKKTITLELILRGEQEIIKVELGEFSLKHQSHQDFLQIGLIQTSREWLTAIGQDYLDGKFGSADIPISRNISLALKFFI